MLTIFDCRPVNLFVHRTGLSTKPLTETPYRKTSTSMFHHDATNIDLEGSMLLADVVDDDGRNMTASLDLNHCLGLNTKDGKAP